MPNRAQAINSERYKAVALSSEPEVGEILGADIAKTQANYDALIAQLDQQLQLPTERQLLAQIQATAKNFALARTELVAARDSGLTARIHEVYQQRFLPTSTALQSALAALNAIATPNHRRARTRNCPMEPPRPNSP
jgi:hypothetical protein